ncbi:HpcH/HpaI aldolase family protein [Calycomorphotria hydatis]|uniref:2-keto-3-deoxy-L-rhamnonate aldolase n=1 Tax=Calycomorphotria hydatis TaxID=2528027 RepID=A0A517TA59_9PLAN|nr:aldolase/citrate lyase family protein [Calycomorphotria hydatis]QDT65258.1 2-keto-3-deoxy-L-rhamnonate aldolase [Calycomorphotria hydatis]
MTEEKVSKAFRNSSNAPGFSESPGMSSGVSEMRLTGEEIRKALRNGSHIYSSAVLAPTTNWLQFVAHAELDFVFIDSEHNPLDRETLAWMCAAFANTVAPPVVRIHSPCPYEAAKVLDAGATGFIAPYIETVEQVRELTKVARYRPLKGKRAQEALENPKALEPELASYLEKQNRNTIFIANIESVPAIENLEKLLEVEGIDAVLIGPHDLSCSLGIPEQYDHPRFDEAVRTIFSTARKWQVGAGIHYFWGAGQVSQWSRTTGSNLFVQSADLLLYGNQLNQEIGTLRSRFTDDVELR